MRLQTMIYAIVLFGLASCASNPRPTTIAKGKSTGTVRIVGDHLEFAGHINFDHDSDHIVEASHSLLNSIVAVLTQHDEIKKVHVHGHTSMQGSPDHNLDLSNRRAAAVVKYLREHGVKQFVDAKGFGLSKPLCQDKTVACHERNRRVEFHLEK